MYEAMILVLIRIEKIRAKTLPSFLGIDRRIEYVNRKYHSCLIWSSVLRVFLLGYSYQGLLISQVKIGLILISELVTRHLK